MSMAFEILTSQLATEITTIIILLLTVPLTLIMTKRYMSKKSKPLLFWSFGMWMFVIGVAEEVIIAFGIYSGLLLNSYLLAVALLVEALALGSMQLIGSKKLKNIYYVFVVISTLLLVVSLFGENITAANALTNNVITALPTLGVTIFSSLITFPAAAILIIIAAKSYKSKKSNKMLSIIIGVIIVSIAGTLYIAAYPAFLYISEFIGILALWYGFM